MGVCYLFHKTNSLQPVCKASILLFSNGTSETDCCYFSRKHIVNLLNRTHISGLNICYISLFQDLNECQGEGGGHTCHPTTHCMNTEGGYQCVCIDETNCVKSKSL